MEDLLPTITPGMVGLRDKKTKEVTAHFPVDVREIMTVNKGKFEIVQNGAVEAARLSANPLKAIQAGSDLLVAEVTGIEGQVLVAMTPEQAEKWKAVSEASTPDAPSKPALVQPADKTDPPTEPKTAAQKAADAKAAEEKK